MSFGVDYYPEHWPRERWNADARLMAEAGIRIARMAEFAWHRIEPDDGVFDFEWLDHAIRTLGRFKIKTVLGTPTAAAPSWLIEKHPDILPVRSDGTRLGFGGRHHNCHSNDVYRESAEMVVRQMARHYRDEELVVGWQIDNELGNSHMDLCYCERCKRGFHLWLRDRYGSVEALNEAWGTVFWSQTYSRFEQVPIPLPTPNAHNPSLLLDWKRFGSDLIVSFQQIQAGILREECPGRFVTHNFMGTYAKSDYFELAKDLDFVSHDQYPLLMNNGAGASPKAADLALPLDFMRAMKRSSFWIMEQQSGPAGWELLGPTPRPGQMRLWTAQSLARGADTIVYFRWRTCRAGTETYWHGVLPHSGNPGRRYSELKQTTEDLGPIMNDLRGRVHTAEAAVLFSYDQLWALQIQPHHPDLGYLEHLRRYYGAFHDRNIPVDFVSLSDDLSAYKLVVAPLVFLTKQEVTERLIDYVRAGGTIVLSMRSGVKDWSNRAVVQELPGPFAELLGIAVGDYDCLRGVEQRVRWEDGESERSEEAVSAWCDIITAKKARVLASYTDDYYAGTPAITVNEYEHGRAYYVGTELGPCLAGILVKHLALVCRLDTVLETPAGVEAVVRPGLERDYLFVLNHNSAPAVVDHPRGWEPALVPGETRRDVPVTLPGFDLAVYSRQG